MERRKIVYNDGIARRFALASILWGLAAMVAGLFAALQLALPEANLPPYLTFGRLRPLHTGTIVFGCAANAIFAGIYVSSQRLLAVRLPSGALGAVHFFGWQLAIAAAAVTLPLGASQGLDLAEMEWPIDAVLAASWTAFAINFFWMVARRGVARLPVAIWFYAAAVIAFGALHVAGSLAVPAGPLKSYPILGGTEGALAGMLYREAGVAFLLAAPLLGFLYDFLPRAAGRPIYSYRLAVLHFWLTIFTAAWVAPRHLVHAPVPEWLPSIGVVFGLLFGVAGLAGATSGLLTLRGAYARLLHDPVLKFFMAAIVCFGLAAVHGAVLGLKSVASLAELTDWTGAQSHLLGLGFTGMMIAALFYWLVPRLYETKLHSEAAAHAHFYLAVVGILFYVGAMGVAGVTQGLMWRAEEPDGGLAYHFTETVAALEVPYWGRLAGGTFYLGGFALMAWNLFRTARAGRPVDGEAEAPTAWRDDGPGTVRLLFASPVIVAAVSIGLVVLAAVTNPLAALAFLTLAFSIATGGMVTAALARRRGEEGWHHRLERRGLAFTLLVALTMSLGCAALMVPLLRGDARETGAPLSALELEGRDVYVAEGCGACHSQLIRPFLWEVARYGEISTAAEASRERPAPFGSRRVGPDLARVGGRVPNLWHYHHLVDPRSVAPGSTMPAYPHLAEESIDFGRTGARMRLLAGLGAPYGEAEIERARDAALEEARAITQDLREAGGIDIAPERKVVALIAYLQRLGQAPEDGPQENK